MKAKDLKTAMDAIEASQTQELDALVLASQQEQDAALSQLCGRYGCPYPLPRRLEARQEMLESYPHTLTREITAVGTQRSAKLDEAENDCMARNRLKIRELLKKAGEKLAVEGGYGELFAEHFAADQSQVPAGAKLFEMVGSDE